MRQRPIGLVAELAKGGSGNLKCSGDAFGPVVAIVQGLERLVGASNI